MTLGPPFSEENPTDIVCTPFVHVRAPREEGWETLIILKCVFRENPTDIVRACLRSIFHRLCPLPSCTPMRGAEMTLAS